LLIKSNFFKYHLPLILYCVFIFILSSIPGTTFPKIEFELSDKIIHIILYSGLGLSFYFSFRAQNKIILLKNYALIFALIFSIFYGYTDEFHQKFVPFRSYDLYDWLTDAVGVILGFIVYFIYKKIRK
jgi:VanZ family protein